MPNTYGVGELTAVGDYLYFIVQPEESMNFELWRTDGTESGTQKVSNTIDGSISLIGAEDVLFYSLNGQLWSYQAEGHQKIAESLQSDTYIIGNECYYFTDANGALELWKTDGTESGTRLLTPVERFDFQGQIKFVGEINNEIIFNGSSAQHGSELFKFSPDYFKCSASNVIAFNQGKKNNGEAVASNRSNPFLALNQPQENNRFNFVALGFGGSITLELEEPVYDEGSAEPDMILVETSFGKASTMCFQEGRTIYPEEAFVEVSQDGVVWYGLPNSYCRTSFLDIKPAVDQGMQYAKYIRITDSSDRSRFDPHADGFDVDGLITCRDEVEVAKNRLTNARTASSIIGTYNPDFYNELPDEDFSAIKLHPNPVRNQKLNVTLTTQANEKLTFNLINALGQTVRRQQALATSGKTLVQINTIDLPNGAYTLIINSIHQKTQARVVIMND